MEIKIDKKAGRNIIITVILILAAYLCLKETERVKAVFSFIYGLIAPFLIGSALAFILNVPMRFFESKLRFVKNEHYRRIIAIIVTLIAVLAVIVAVVQILYPQIKSAIQVFSFQLPDFFTKVNEYIQTLLDKYPQIKDALGVTAEDGAIDWMSLVDKVMAAFETNVSGLVGNVIGMVSNLVSAIYTGIFSFIFAFYCLARKETLARQARKMLYSLVQERKADEVVRVLRMSNSVFSNFITGQCLDAVILGIMCTITMAILQMPYIPLIAVIIIVTALIPVVGALVGGAIGAFLIFVNSPMQALIFIVMFIIVQQIDNNIVYPRVVGSSIGLPGMWVLLAVLVGEGLMGVAGMLIMVPFASVIYTLLQEFVARRVKERDIPADKLRPHPPELQPHFMFRKSQQRKQARKATKQDEAPEPEQTEQK